MVKDRVQEDDDVFLLLGHAFGFLQDHLGDLHVSLGGLVESGGDDFPFDVPLHVGHLFRALVDEEHDQGHLGMVLGDPCGDILEHDRLPGLRRRVDEGALAFAERGDQIHHAGR